MRVAAVQFCPEFGEVEKNINKAFALMETVEADLFVLPELCFTGYTFTSKDETASLAESSTEGFSLNRIREFSKKKDAGVIYGFPEIEGENLFNSCLFVSPSGETHLYRKLHLYYYEKDWFMPGNLQLSVFDYRGGKLGMMICFDWIFPEVCRTLALKGAQLICHPANLVMRYCQDAMVVRSVENWLYTISVNRIGREKRGGFDFEFTGGSQILSNKGEILYQAARNKEEVGVADINLEACKIKGINSRNNLWADRRPEYYRMEPNREKQS